MRILVAIEVDTGYYGGPITTAALLSNKFLKDLHLQLEE